MWCCCLIRLDPALDHFLVHYAAQGWLVSADSEEGKHVAALAQASAASKVAWEGRCLARW